MPAMKFGLLIFTAFTVLSASVRADGEFDAANRAYEEGKFVEARERYEALLARGERTANIYFNLGNTNARIGANGLAILDYERALALEPSHSEAKANLKFLRDQSTAKLPVETWKQRAFGALTLNGWIIAATGFGWILVLFIFVPLITARRRTAVGIFASILTLFVFAYAAAGVWFTSRELDSAIVIVKQTDARRAPADRADLADVLPLGSKIRWLSERSGWVECELPDGSLGWVPAESVERVRPIAS
jgi:tetratricopeptide (TPR) repeat protein